MLFTIENIVDKGENSGLYPYNPNQGWVEIYRNNRSEKMFLESVLYNLSATLDATVRLSLGFSKGPPKEDSDIYPIFLTYPLGTDQWYSGNELMGIPFYPDERLYFSFTVNLDRIFFIVSAKIYNKMC